MCIFSASSDFMIFYRRKSRRLIDNSANNCCGVKLERIQRGSFARDYLLGKDIISLGKMRKDPKSSCFFMVNMLLSQAFIVLFLEKRCRLLSQILFQFSLLAFNAIRFTADSLSYSIPPLHILKSGEKALNKIRASGECEVYSQID